MSSKLLQKGFSGSIHQYLSAFFTAIFNLLITVYIVRKLTVEDFGIYNFIISIILVAQIFTSLGLGPIIHRYLPEYKEKTNNYLQKRIATWAMLIRFFAALVFVLILLSSSHKIVNIFNLPAYSKDLFPIIAFIILIVLESQLLEGILIALLENKYWNFCKIVYSISKFAFFYLIISYGYGLKGIALAWLIAELILLIMLLIKGYHIVFCLPLKKEDIQKIPIKKFISFGGYLYFYNVGYIFRDKTTDILLLSYFLGSHEVGLYSFAFGIPLMLMMFSPGAKLRAVLTPLLIRRYTKTNSKEELSYYFKFVNRIIFFTMVPVFLIVMILADKIILYAFNPEYLKVRNLFILSIGFMMLQQFTFTYYIILFTLEKGRIIFTASLVSLYNLIMDIILIPIYGVLGAIIATGSAGIITLFYYHFVLKKIINLPYPWESFGKYSINILITGLAVFTLRIFISNILSLLLIVIVGAIVYLILSYINKGFEEEDRRILNMAIGRKVWVF